MANSSNFGGKKAAPFVSAKGKSGKQKVRRKKSSSKTAKGTKKGKMPAALAAYRAKSKGK